MGLFGLPLDQDVFDVDTHADLIGIRKLVINSRAVHKLKEEAGAHHPIVLIAKRQAILKHLKGDLESTLKPYDPLFYKKEVNTAEDADRTYAAEDKLLQYCLIAACGKPLKKISQEQFKPDAQALRSTPPKERYNRYWAILADHTRDAIHSYQAEVEKKAAREAKSTPDSKSEDEAPKDKKKDEGGFWSKLFG